MNPKLFNLLRDTSQMSDDNDSDYTHYTYFGPAKRWTLKSTEYTKFWKEYCRLALNSLNGISTEVLSVGERNKSMMPVIAMFKFEFSILPGVQATEYLNDEFITYLVKCYQETLEDNFILIGNGIELVCCVLEQDNGNITGSTININLKLHFPYCKVDTKTQTRIIRPKVIEKLRHENFRSLLASEPINSWEDCIDIMVLNEPLPLYRSITSISSHPLSCTHIYSKLDNKCIENKNYPEYKFSDVFKPQYMNHVHSGLINSQMFEDPFYDDGYKPNIDIWMPIFLSIEYFQVITHPKESIKNSNILSPVNSLSSSNGNISNKTDIVEDRDIDIAEILINMLSDKRSKDENYWLDIGKALYTCDDEFEGRGYKLWISFTEKGDRYREDCEPLWDTFEIDNAITIKTIAFYARQDNENIYKQWHNKKCAPFLEKATSFTDWDISLALYWVYWIDFTCSDAKKGGSWHVFKNHRWIPCDDGIELTTKISSDFRAYFERLRTQKSLESERTFDENIKEKNRKLIDKINTLTVKLKQGPIKSAIMKGAREHFKDDKFNRFMNENPNYMGVMNGVIETCSTEAVFRDGKPEDYVTMCSTVRYHPEYTWDHRMVKLVMVWMSQCFVDNDLMNYFLKLFASFLRSGNMEKIFPCMTGSGDNSKSMIKLLLELVFGSYAFTFSTETLMSRNAARANQQKALARYAKIVFASEPDNDSKFKSGIIKELTGLEKIYGSLLYDNGGNFMVMFVLILITNKMPIIPGADNAIIQRLRALPFLSKWVKNAPKTKEEQFEKKEFPLDRTFSKRIPGMAPAFLWVLVQKYADYIENGLTEPAAVIEATHEYWEEHDIYLHFTRECIETAIIPGSQYVGNEKGTINKNIKMTIPEVYNSFKFWVRDTYPEMSVPNQPEMKNQLGQRWGKPSNNEWPGVQLKQMTADILMSGFNYSSHP